MIGRPICAHHLVLVATLVAALAGCGPPTNVPTKSEKEYRDAVSMFYVSLAAIEVGDDLTADKKLTALTQLAPGEPTAWGNWGVLALRQRSLEKAGERLERARDLAPKDAHIYNLLGLFESGRGRSDQAIANLRKAAELDPRDLRNRYSLAQEIERQGGAGSEVQFQELIQQMLSTQPGNIALLLELARIAAKRGDAPTLQSAVAKLAGRSASWPPEVREQFAALQTAATGNDLRAAATRTTLLRNVLWRVVEFRQDYAVIKAPAGEEIAPYARMLRIEAPPWTPAPADSTLSFDIAPIAGAGDGRWNWVGAIQLAGEGAPVLAEANAEALRLPTNVALPFPGGATKTPPSVEGVLQIDFNYDFKTDLVLAGAGGVRFYRQDDDAHFIDVSHETQLPDAVLQGHYTGAWAVDVENDGDLDVVLASEDTDFTVLRNNGDGTFAVADSFARAPGLKQLVWADIDGDGVPDITLIDGADRLHVFINARQGQYRERPLPPNISTVKAIAAGDFNNDGMLDILAVQADGAVVRISDKNEGQAWDVAELARVPDAASFLAADVRLHVADLDNNGALDFYLARVGGGDSGATGALIWLGNDKGQFTRLERVSVPALVFEAADVNGDGKLDLIGLSVERQAVQAINRATRSYHWQIVRPHAAQAVGDQRINPFGIGGEIEIRAGLLVQKQPITGPQIHFGLGWETSTDVVRVVWPNGAVRAEFDVNADQDVETEQRLKGSCPFLFAFDGKAMTFVKDAVPWGSAIGLRINTLGSASIAATEEWFKIGRDQLVPRDGYYDLRFTAELWEVYYYDHLSLMAVDHPKGTEIFVDERFVIPPAKLAITTVQAPNKIARATDDKGQDVTALLSALDGKAVDSFGRGQYQGVTRDHYLEIDLGPDAPQDGTLYLIAHGSLYPTDSSINVALSQGNRWRAHGLKLEVPDGGGGWMVAQDNLGFPAGRLKTVLFNLTDVFKPGTPRRVRLWTNLEIYWDKIEWAKGLPDAGLKTTRLDPVVADLHFRGYSVIEKANAAAPEVPDYGRLAGSKQRWRDLTGYYTRYGDVRELLKAIDDRYVIMSSGDEMSLRFTEQPPPPDGWLRDFVIMGDGWIKDGDYNSTFSDSVLPLPHHGEERYATREARLEDERAFQMHSEDWENYHTRYVTADVFRNALRRHRAQ